MDKARFKDLLTDLYEKYNKAHLVYVDDLVQRNYDSPFAAVDSIFLKYNHKSMSHFDPEKATNEYKIELIKSYEAGNRPFREVDIRKEAEAHQENKEEEIVKKVEEQKKEVDELLNEKVKTLADEVMQAVRKEMGVLKENALNELRKSSDDSVDYIVTIDDVGEDVVLPNKKHLAALGMNARLIVRSVSNKAIGLIIKDIAYDSFSLENKVIVSIHLEKG